MTLIDLDYPLVIAHRGYRAAFPENTLIAFDAAFKAGARMIELDVTLSRDRQPVVIHDERLERTTSGRGPVRNSSLEELKRIDAGSWFDSRFSGERIPALQEVLERFGSAGYINIEIKPAAFEGESPPDAVERQVFDMVMCHNLQGRVLISSFEVACLERLSRMKPPPALGLLTEQARFETARRTCVKLGAFSWHPGQGEFDSDQVKCMHADGIKVFPYTVNRRDDMLGVLALGVDGFFSDDPVAALATIKDKRHGPPRGTVVGGQ